MARGEGEVIRGQETMRAGTFAALVAVGVVSCSNQPTETTSIEAPLVAGITDDAFRTAADCPDCAVLTRSTVNLPLTGKVFTQVKLASTKAQAAHAAALDGDGKKVDPRALLAAEGAAKIARQGKLRDDAYARSLTSSEELVPIAIWADFRDRHLPRELMIANSTLRITYQADAASRLQAATSKITRWLDARGFRTYDRGIDSPLITADVPASALAALGRLDGVAIVHLKQPEVLASFNWYDAVKGPAAHAVVGAVGGLPFCNGEGWQPDDYTYTPAPAGQIFDSTAITSPHTRWTSELIAATTSIRMAPGASLYMASWHPTTGSMYDAWSWCYGLGIHNMNRSAGIGFGPLAPQADDMAQDYYAYHWPWPTITLAAGNCANAQGFVIACDYDTNVRNVFVGNRSYNTLIVGASDGKDTSQTNDDALGTFSQYLNPNTTNGDHELPNLVAPGDEINGFGINVSSATHATRGTSASAPITLGTVLLMKTRDSGFNYWPEMVRATVMTASTHPVFQGTGRTVRLGDPVDHRHGAGLLNAAVAVSLADPNYYVSGPNNPGTSQGRTARWYDFSTDFPNSVSEPYNIVAWNGGRLRVVAAWDATAQGCEYADGSGCTGDTLDGDLDLRVSRWTLSGWTTACISTSYDSAWEICDVAVVEAGDIYKAELIKYTTTASGTYVGIAWNNYSVSAE
jgi:hypothetical protein